VLFVPNNDEINEALGRAVAVGAGDALVVAETGGIVGRVISFV
jgi:hypothetical protein